MYYENNVQSAIRKYPIIALHEHEHFLVNNLHFITYSIHLTLNATDSEFSTQLSPVLTFSTNRIRF